MVLLCLPYCLRIDRIITQYKYSTKCRKYKRGGEILQSKAGKIKRIDALKAAMTDSDLCGKCLALGLLLAYNKIVETKRMTLWALDA
jgi:hypothetical protein